MIRMVIADIKSAKIKPAKKAQAWYIDFMVGLLIFTMIVIIYYQYYETVNEEAESNWEEMIIDSKSISSSLLSPGYPEGWDNESVEIVGMTDGNYRINYTKTGYLKNMTYRQLKDTIKTRFDFYFFLQDQNGTIIEEFGANTTSPEFLVQATRFAICNSSICRMVLHLWKEGAE
jgi:hypothetical protein